VWRWAVRTRGVTDESGDGFGGPLRDNANSCGLSTYWNSRDGCDPSGERNARVRRRTRTPAALDDPNPGVPTNPDDPLCATMPLVAQCQGGPYAPPANPSGLPTNPSDPGCVATPGIAQCQGGPYAQSANPTSPTSTACISNPSDPVCAGGPYAPPQPPPPPAGTPPPATAAGAPITPPPDAPPPDAPIAPPPEAPIGGGMPGGDIGGDMPDMGGMHIGGAGRR
jgi:hypothetical protein